MPLAFAVEETIQKPIEQVWAVLTDWSRAPKWMNGVDRMWANGETVEGTQLTFHARGADRSSVILRCAPGQSIALRSVQGAVTADYTYTLYSIGSNTTRIELTAECQTAGMIWKLLFPLLRLAIKNVDGKQLSNLKRLVEA